MPPSSQPAKSSKQDAEPKGKGKQGKAKDGQKDIQMKPEHPTAGDKRGSMLIDPDSDLSGGSAAGDITPDHSATAPADLSLHEKIGKLFDIVSGSAKQHAEQIEKLTNTISEHQNRNDNHFHTMRNSLTDAIELVNGKLEASDLANQTKFREMEAKLQVVSDRLDDPASSSRPSFASHASHRAPASVARAGPQEDCLVFIRGFPSTQPNFILRKYADEAIAILPDSEKLMVKLRIPPADTQFSMVFPSSSMAANFVENYRALGMVFLDADKNETPLFCRTGKPLAFRRRGGLIRPVYTELEGILRKTHSFSNATISQSSKTRAGKMTTEFFALVGPKLSPLFTLVFLETPEEMSIEQVVSPIGGSALSTDDFALIVKVAAPK
jgi:hypothetical protein